MLIYISIGNCPYNLVYMKKGSHKLLTCFSTNNCCSNSLVRIWLRWRYWHSSRVVQNSVAFA